MTVFRFNIHFGNDDVQRRYVVATTEEEAVEKLESYRRDMVWEGFANFTYDGPWVEIDNVIV